MSIDIQDLAVGYHRGAPVASGITFTVHPGELVCLLGPNGVGKTTLFRTVLGSLPALDGVITVDGTPARHLSTRAFARRVAYVPQDRRAPFAFTVRDAVVMGRMVHMGRGSQPSAEDYRLADAALTRLGVSALRDRVLTQLSGGEWQMVLIARALAQSSRYLLLDEPTSALDYGNQVRVLRALRSLAAEGKGILMTTHNPNHLLALDARGVLLKPGHRVVVGSAREVVTPAHLEEAYGVHVAMTSVMGPGGRTILSCTPVV